MAKKKHTVGIVGARGHVGAELIKLVDAHPELALAFVVSRELAGATVPRAKKKDAAIGLVYENLDPGAVAARGADVVFLALPNGAAATFVGALDKLAPDALIVDLSADYRFDERWFYGLPELYRGKYQGQRRIANPGCYATAMQLAIAPLIDRLDGPVQCFGVSGYSGAGTSPSDKNDPDKLRDNIMPYSLVGHIHEKEATRHLAHPVEFMPHVAAHFRGITMTVNAHVKQPLALGEAARLFRTRYENEPLIAVDTDIPWVSAIAGKHGAQIGGFAQSEDGRRVVVAATIDNLLKGAATQALQNVNLALGFAETTGIA